MISREDLLEVVEALDRLRFATDVRAAHSRIKAELDGIPPAFEAVAVWTYNLRPNRRNPHCSNCGDLRGGPLGHEISECTFNRD